MWVPDVFLSHVQSSKITEFRAVAKFWACLWLICKQVLMPYFPSIHAMPILVWGGKIGMHNLWTALICVILLLWSCNEHTPGACKSYLLQWVKGIGARRSPPFFSPAMLFARDAFCLFRNYGSWSKWQKESWSGFFWPFCLRIFFAKSPVVVRQFDRASSVMSKPVLHDLWGATTGIKWSWNPLVREDWAKRIQRQIGKKNPDIFGPDHMSGFFWPRMFLVCDLSKNDEKNPDEKHRGRKKSCDRLAPFSLAFHCNSHSAALLKE